MNIEAYNLDSLRKIVRRLFSENRRLKQQLKDANIPFESEDPFSESIEQTGEYDPDQGKAVIFHNAINGGITTSAQNSEERNDSVTTVSTRTGNLWHPKPY